MAPYWKHKHISSCAWSKAAAAAERCTYMFQGGRSTENKSNRTWRTGGQGKVSLTGAEINKGRTVKERPG